MCPSPYIENEARRLGMYAETKRNSSGTSHDALYVPLIKSRAPVFPWGDFIQGIILLICMVLAIPAVELIVELLK